MVAEWCSCRRNVCLFVLGVAVVVGTVDRSVTAQDAAAVRTLLQDRVGALSKLQVPEDVADFPYPRLGGGEVDPRFVTTPEKVFLGRLLFFDPIRSTHILPEFGGMPGTAQSGSCASCHIGEAATKAGVVSSVSVGGLGRHVMAIDGTKTITRTAMDVEDTLPTGVELVDDQGDVVESGMFDSVDAPGRVAPSVIGFAFNQRLLWGGEAGEPNANGYPAQEDIVLKASMAHRMANPDNSHLHGNDVYRALFAAAFPDENAAYLQSGDLYDLIGIDTQVRAIASFLRTVITRNTPWDRFLAGDDGALTSRQLRGAWLFARSVASGGANCIACHSGPALNKVLGDEDGLLVDENFHNLGAGEHPLQELARSTLADPTHHDVGRGGVLPTELYKFKTPTLRQMKDAAPFFHGGHAATLREAVEYHLDGIADDPLAGAAGTLAPLFSDPHGDGSGGIVLPQDDVDALVDFLDNGLYDESLVRSIPGDPAQTFELNAEDLTYSDELKALGAVDGWLPSLLPNGFADPVSREQIVFVRGNVNGDSKKDLADAVYMLEYLFRGRAAPQPMASGDINDDRRVDLADPVYFVLFLFRGGSAPPYPYPDPGQDLTP